MKYTIETFGTPCHYQFSNIEDIKVIDIEYGEMDYLNWKKPFFQTIVLLKMRRLVLTMGFSLK